MSVGPTMTYRLGLGPQEQHSTALREGQLVSVATALIAGDLLFNDSTTNPHKKQNNNELWRTTPCIGRDLEPPTDDVPVARPGSPRRRTRYSSRRCIRRGDMTYPCSRRGSPDPGPLDASHATPCDTSARTSRRDGTPRTSGRESPARAAPLAPRPFAERSALDGRQRCAAASDGAMFSRTRASPERAARLVNSRRPSPEPESRRAARFSSGWPGSLTPEPVAERASLPARNMYAAKETDHACVGGSEAGPLPFDLSFEPEWSECGGCSVSPWLRPPSSAGTWFPAWAQLRTAPDMSDSVTYFTSEPPGAPIHTVTLMSPQHAAPTAPTPGLERFLRESAAEEPAPAPVDTRSHSPTILEAACKLIESASVDHRRCSAAVEAEWLPEEREQGGSESAVETWTEAAASGTSVVAHTTASTSAHTSVVPQQTGGTSSAISDRASVVTQRTAGKSERASPVAQTNTGTSPCAHSPCTQSPRALSPRAHSPRAPSPRLFLDRHRATSVAVQAHESQTATNIKQIKITGDCRRRGVCSVSTEWVDGVRALRDSHVQIMSRHLRHIDLLNRTIDAATPRLSSPSASPSPSHMS